MVGLRSVHKGLVSVPDELSKVVCRRRRLSSTVFERFSGCSVGWVIEPDTWHCCDSDGDFLGLVSELRVKSVIVQCVIKPIS